MRTSFVQESITHPPIRTVGEHWFWYMLDVITEGGRRGRGDDDVIQLSAIGGESCACIQGFFTWQQSKKCSKRGPKTE